MKLSYVLSTALAVGLLGLSAPGLFAADNEQVQVQSDQSTNPLTKTVTKKREYKHEKNLQDGRKSETDETVTHKTMRDGSTKTDLEKETTTTPAR
jgi:hypothetical protein